MKKVFCLFLALMFVVSLVSCSKSKDKTTTTKKLTPAERVEQEISRMNSQYSEYKEAPDKQEKAFSYLMTAYNALSESEKEEVKNADKLDEIEKKIVEGWQKNKAIEQATSNIDSIKRNLLNPTSYIQNNVSIDGWRNKDGATFIYIKIDYSAQNRAGGYNRETETDYYRWISDTSTYAHGGRWSYTTFATIYDSGETYSENESESFYFTYPNK